MDLVPKPKMCIETLILIGIAGGLFTWFSCSALGSGEIQMGTDGQSGSIRRADDPANYWVSVILFLGLAAILWILLIWKSIVYVRDKA